MKTQKLLLTSILTISVFGLFGAVLASGLLPTTASAGGLLMAHNHGGHGGWGRHCGADQEHAAELIHAFVSIRLDLDEAQESALATAGTGTCRSVSIRHSPMRRPRLQP
jgi:hypothetical protein